MFGRSKKFRHILQTNWQSMYRVAYSWSHDKEVACDLVQEAMARCLRNVEIFSCEKDTKAWLFKVMKNCWNDYLRKKKPDYELDAETLDHDFNLENEIYQQQLVKRLQTAFAKMKINHREILSLVVLEDFSYEEAAKILNIPTGTVMSRVSRARQALRNELHDITAGQSTPVLWRIK